MARTEERRVDRRSKPPARKFTSFTPLIAPIDQVLMQIKDERALTFLGNCCFHRDHGHDIVDCYNLKQQIESLIRQGKLQRFVNKERVDPPQEQVP